MGLIQLPTNPCRGCRREFKDKRRGLCDSCSKGLEYVAEIDRVFVSAPTVNCETDILAISGDRLEVYRLTECYIIT